MKRLKLLNSLIFLFFISHLLYGCGKKADPIAPDKKIISTDN